MDKKQFIEEALRFGVLKSHQQILYFDLEGTAVEIVYKNKTVTTAIAHKKDGVIISFSREEMEAITPILQEYLQETGEIYY